MSGPPSTGECLDTIETGARWLLRRAQAGDVGALKALDDATTSLDKRTRAAGAMLHRTGHSWRDLGILLGLSARAAAHRCQRLPTPRGTPAARRVAPDFQD